ncbi:CoB/CoM heterodisulfide reductase, subunit C [Methanosalsum zhilinae DSM 4017]|uniref:CoB/CoM heterodisulfide reductase, subunit C n=1 Tax=Methanosalsum zhilinae (strain DSM 4017 / NBRC 107636 / OCM 62 / WeN5) TaxID=679901 RepID=F7XP11_METZD|nr:CoB--CoM heterodisulfide reductase subunit C [Methanosalsum zhilinae]AEH60205.1 CoB/CoM heterodisulfide reductase, subunit C [Methanosalsum zhilinae DSM 4017]
MHGTLEEILKNENIDVLKCMQCGVCSASCPSGRHMTLNVRKLVRRASRKIFDLGEEEMWMCTTCYTCQERCPRKIRIADTILAVRSKAVLEGFMKFHHRNVAHMFIETGHAVPINQENIDKREKLGLRRLPATVASRDQALDDLKKLLRSCSFDMLVEYDSNE